jgi:hypothetical protein
MGGDGKTRAFDRMNRINAIGQKTTNKAEGF